MQKTVVFFFIVIFTSYSYSQKTAVDILQRSIEVHNPKDNWQKAKLNLQMSIVRTNHADRLFFIDINLPKKSFFYSVKNDTVNFSQGIKSGKHIISHNGNKHPSAAIIKQYDLTPTRTQNLKEVYEYLQLLPMRLKNDIPLLSKNYTIERFQNADCYKLTIQYEPINENETWHFFIDTQTYILRGYQFYVKDKSTNGEYIFLEDYTEIRGILMPKTKRWYWNKDDSFFRTDRILKY